MLAKLLRSRVLGEPARDMLPEVQGIEVWESVESVTGSFASPAGRGTGR